MGLGEVDDRVQLLGRPRVAGFRAHDTRHTARLSPLSHRTRYRQYRTVHFTRHQSPGRNLNKFTVIPGTRYIDTSDHDASVLGVVLPVSPGSPPQRFGRTTAQQ